MIRLVTAVIVVLCVSWTAFSQGPAPRSARALQTRTTVPGNVTVQAVLIPRVDARRIFGKEIADNYAIIELNVGNKSPDAALIIHGVFIDYTQWPLSGTPPTEGSGLEGLFRERAEPFEASTKPNQVASEEYRVVRSQLLDAQMWTKRNWTMRLLTLAGSLASAYAFSIGEEGIVRGLNAFSGSVVPGIREAWPDGTVQQLNNISDFGYQTNKVIPKQAGEVIVCFFPIDRFLTPGFKKLFLKSPALFFAPLQMLVDPDLRNDADKILKSIDSKLSAQDLAGYMPCYLQMVNMISNRGTFGRRVQDANTRCEEAFGLQPDTDRKGRWKIKDGDDAQTAFKKFMAIDFISQMSLNTVTVRVDGAMTVETTAIRSRIDAVVFDRLTNCGGPTEPCFWADVQAGGGVRTATIEGSYLTGGTVEIERARDLGIEDITIDAANSTDQQLRFSFRLTRAISPQTLRFIVSKPGANPGDPALESLPREVPIGYTITTPPVVTAVTANGNELTVTGSGFFDIPNLPLAVEVTGKDGKKVNAKITSTTSTELKLTLENPQPNDCWTVRVTVGTLGSPPKSTCEP